MIESDNLQKPHRRRMGWGGRLLIGLALLVPLIVIGHLAWVLYEQGALRHRVTALRAQGEPIVPADFAAAKVADGDNGGPAIIAAGDRIQAYRKAHPQIDALNPDFPLRPDERKLLEAEMRDNAAVLADFERAAALPRAEWNLDFTSPVLFKIMLPTMSGTRSLSHLLRERAMLDHEGGDDADALRRVHQMILLARFSDNHPSLVGHLVALGISGAASGNVMDLAPDLRIGNGRGEATPQAVRALIDELLDDQPPREGLRRALRGERMGQLDSVTSFDNGSLLPASGAALNINPTPLAPAGKTAPVRYVLRPIVLGNARSMLDYMTQMLPAADAPDWPAAKAKIPPLPSQSVTNLMSNILLPALDRAVLTHHRDVGERRLAAAALAIRWYAVDHPGKWPATLDELAPKYLPAVPIDPLVGGTHRIGYNAATTQPIVWDAGQNGVDDGGKQEFIRPPLDGSKPQHGSDWSTLDRVVHLTRQPRPATEPNDAPATEPGDQATPDPMPSTAPAKPTE